MSRPRDDGLSAIAGLCRYYQAHRDRFRASPPQPAQVRQALIAPFFEALGWKVRAEPPAPPHLREVIRPDRPEFESAGPAPDYAFCVDKTPKFFVRAAELGGDLRADADSAQQLRRYGWNAKVALSILTDFEQLCVYDCTIRPRPGDQARHARVLCLRYDEYEARWPELGDIFSREAVWSGAFDRYAASQRKRGTWEVDAVLLQEIGGWRESLARNLALRHADVAPQDLNAVVQGIVERLVFLRLAEARGLEPHGQLLELCQRPESYARFVRERCRRGDGQDDPGPFRLDGGSGVPKAPDRTASMLTVDDEVFQPIVRSLYFAHGSPFDFRVLPVEILGTVYERFLGQAIRLTNGRPAVARDKTEMRRAGGVYYTPSVIVDHIVRHTVGRLIEGKSPAQLAGGKSRPPLRVLDMACGSGSFLLGAYQCLLEHCLAWYGDRAPKASGNAVYRDRHTGEWRLTVAEKKRILITHVFGVDLDPQAVEVTKRSLLLKALEGEDDATRSGQRRLFHDRVLPDLGDNIKSGNALIGPDFYAGCESGSVAWEQQRRIKAFDWHAGFQPILASGGFDVVLGNPPYVNARLLFQEQGEEIKRYFGRRYRTARRGYDLYVLFVEKSLELVRHKGLCGMILPNKIGTLDYAEACRAMLLNQTSLEQITDVSELRVFPAAGVYPYVMVWKNSPPDSGHVIRIIRACQEQDLRRAPPAQTLRQRDVSAAGGFMIHGSLDVESRVPTQPLADRCTLHSGTTGFAATAMANSLREQADAGGGECLEFVVSGNIDRYALEFGGVRFMNRTFTRPVLPADRGHLTENKRRLFRSSKLVIAGMTKRLEVAPDLRGGVALGVSVYAAAGLADNPLYLLGVLNSKLLSYLLRIRFQAKHLAGGFLAINKGQLAKLPIRVVDPAVAEDRQRHDRIVSLAEKMTVLVRQRGRSGFRRDAILERQIDSLDAEIDQLVNELYRLTDAEIRLVREAIAETERGRRGE
ncbi:MAG: N-6 DNA methylase [Candidatus Anammoximicrobium sp.]|nr:N-6 DNA methylase [Candidatus Anammoximicrobium sp.]